MLEVSQHIATRWYLPILDRIQYARFLRSTVQKSRNKGYSAFADDDAEHETTKLPAHPFWHTTILHEKSRTCLYKTDETKFLQLQNCPTFPTTRKFSTIHILEYSTHIISHDRACDSHLTPTDPSATLSRTNAHLRNYMIYSARASVTNRTYGQNRTRTKRGPPPLINFWQVTNRFETGRLNAILLWRNLC